MKIKIVTSVFIDGVAHDTGDVVDVSDGKGVELIGINRAEAIAADPAPAAPAQPEPAS
jgi:hypothetical protein